MDHDTIESAFVPFLTELRQADFAEPRDGWGAELVAAHVTCNNDLIAEAAEEIAAGKHPTYDNAAAIDEAKLRAYVAEVGGIAGLAAALEASARRLAAARLGLDETNESYPLPAFIRDSGKVVNDGPVPIAKLIEGNASFHLEMHLDQLRSLHREHPRTADPPPEFDVYEVVLLRRPKERPEIDEAAADLLQRQHLGHFANMTEAGYMKAVGPLAEQPDDSWRGICIYQVGSVDEARRLAEMDPAVQAGQFGIDVMRWFTAKGALRSGA